MNKKTFQRILVFTVLLASACLYFFKTPSPSSDEPCLFCDRAVLNRQKFYEDDLVVALYTHKPIVPGHILIIPKRHIERFEGLSDVEMVQISRVIKKIDQTAMRVFQTSSYVLIQKNGAEVGQSVPHVHFHYVPKKAGDNAIISFMFKIWIAGFKKPISENEMSTVVQALTDAIHSDSG